QAVLDAGADKVSVNSAAVARPELLAEMAGVFGDQCVVLAIDARRRAAGDGTSDGYDLELVRTVSEAVGVPVIASGGAGELEHLAEALRAGADAALAA